MGKFTNWIYNNGGTRLVSVELELSQSTVQHWIARRRVPNRNTRKKLIKLSKGAITERDILRDTHRENKN